MEKVYNFENGTIYVVMPESCDREKLRQVTEEFLKKAISGGIKNGNSDTRTNFREK